MIVGVLFGLGAFLILVWWAVEYYRHFKGVLTIPTPRFVVPIFGHLFLLTTVENAYWDLHRITVEVGKSKIIRGCIGYYFAINVADPVVLEHLLTNTSVINKSRFYRFIHQWLGTGLLTSEHEKWRVRRKLLTPAYHFKILEQFIDVFDKNSNILVKRLKNEIKNDSTDIYPYITLCALDTICETAMGTCVNAQECSDSEYVQAIKSMSQIFIERGVSVIKQVDFLYHFTDTYRKELKNLKILHGYTMSVIKSRRDELIAKQKENGKISNEENTDENLGYKAKVPFLDLLLQASFNGAPLTDEDIREEVDTFMFEGHDTTSSAISFCLYNIATHPHVQHKILEEQRCIYEDKPHRETTYQDLQEMKYLEMAIKESLRLYPAVPIFGRTVNEDFSFGEYSFKKGTEICCGVFTMHRNPEIYPDPEVFKPERFSPDVMNKRHPFAFIPFSAGFRNCVGQKFAMMEMKSTISMVVRNFVLQQIPNFEPSLKSGLILTSGNGVRMKIRNRIW